MSTGGGIEHRNRVVVAGTDDPVVIDAIRIRGLLSPLCTMDRQRRWE